MTTPTPAEAVRILRDMRKLVTARADWQESLEAGAAALVELPKLRAEVEKLAKWHPKCPDHAGQRTACGQCLGNARARVAELEREVERLEGVLVERDKALAAVLDRERDYQSQLEREKAKHGEKTERAVRAESRIRALEAGLRGLEQCCSWSDTMQCWVLMGNERTMPALREARALLETSAADAEASTETSGGGR